MKKVDSFIIIPKKCKQQSKRVAFFDVFDSNVEKWNVY